MRERVVNANENDHGFVIVNMIENDDVASSESENGDVVMSKSKNGDVATNDQSKVCENQNESFLPDEREV